jgi:hypothetical protein
VLRPEGITDNNGYSAVGDRLVVVPGLVVLKLYLLSLVLGAGAVSGIAGIDRVMSAIGDRLVSGVDGGARVVSGVGGAGPVSGVGGGDGVVSTVGDRLLVVVRGVGGVGIMYGVGGAGAVSGVGGFLPFSLQSANFSCYDTDSIFLYPSVHSVKNKLEM